MDQILPGSELGFLLGDAARLWRQTMERALFLADMSLTASELRALTYVGRFEGARQKDLADLMGIAPMTMSQLIETLEKRELVERRVDQVDRRARRIHLTARSTAVFESLAPASSMMQANALVELSAEQRQVLKDALRCILRSLSLHGNAFAADLAADEQLKGG
ncbi:MarR family winged helix-turn-helix transcriptional regulator [Antarcticirhabdus aurantiaca]|uniref:MarR family winged helix-turn-helix transcriptional regulator n=1 Tax=Antarcticirhabdus aurantiaca TaxID=2606717 RepID=A0ACD4NM44_9HYPH|nr:MarR family winged helix-turn-helix transcriptional regulator [Antarcticirhabdus aurantiaca]WAJ27894.1 MarR family winged helix-turn-helix transcriptional regulator [Jeongeuplla avenae]